MISIFKPTALAVATCLMAASSGLPLLAQGDPEAGEKVFKRCKTCHQVGEGAKNGAGPVLTNVVGNAAGSVDGYKYSNSLKAASEADLIWNERNLVSWLLGPSDFMKEVLDDGGAKSKMAFKLKKPEDAANVIAYLATFSGSVAGSEAKAMGAPTSGHSDDEYGDILFRGPGMRVAEDSSLPQPGDDAYEIAEFSTAEDLEYMRKVIARMNELNLLGGPEAIHTPIYPGIRPHGILLSTIFTRTEIEGQSGELIVKRSFEHDEAESNPQKAITEVQADPDKYLHNYAIMFRREDGYQDAHQNWYYAEFDPIGEPIVYEGNVLVGRNDLCISCHVQADGDDYLFTTDAIK